MSTFLQLVQKLHEEVRATGSGPSAVTNQSGEYKRLVSHLRDADAAIQRRHNEWLFMKPSFTVNTVADQAAYTPVNCGITLATFRNWVLDKFKIYLLSGGIAGQMPLDYMDYDKWDRIYNTGLQTSSFPTDFTILPSRSFSLGPKPNAVYVVTGEYQRAVTELAEDADVPAYPDEYHNAAVWLAVKNWGISNSAQEIFIKGRDNFAEMISQMERTQLPEIMMGAPLVS